MILTKHLVTDSAVWAIDRRTLPKRLGLAGLLSLERAEMKRVLAEVSTEVLGEEPLLAPVENGQEIWASGVTYLSSKLEREAESSVADVYGMVYEARRPELFFKSLGWRAIGSKGTIRIRKDSTWNVPEPELTLVVNRFGEIVGYTAGNDVSSRSIEGENPLYLPQAKSYDGACAIGPSIVLCSADEMRDLPIELKIIREGIQVFTGDARTSQMKRTLEELVEHLFRETSFPQGALLLTGTCIVPPPNITLLPGDTVLIYVGQLILENVVA